MSQLTARQLLGAARIRVWRKHPYFSAILFNLKPVELPGIQGLAIDKGMRLFYDPAFVTTVAREHVASFVAHEVDHIVMQHHKRLDAITASMRPRYQKLAAKVRAVYGCETFEEMWNYATDFAINPGMRAAGWEYPEGWNPLMPHRHGLQEGKTAESYMDAMLKRAEKEPDSESQKDATGRGGAGSGCPDPGESESREAAQASGADGSEGGYEAPESPGETRENDSKESPAGSDQEGDGDSDGSQDGEGDVENDPPQDQPPGGNSSDQPDPAQDDDRDAPEGEGDHEHEHPGADSPGSAGAVSPVSTGRGGCGSCSGQRSDFEAKVSDDWPEETSETRKETMIGQVAQAVIGHSGRGTAPASWLREWAMSMFAPPKVDWRKLLPAEIRGAVTAARGKTDWRYGRPSRRREVLKARGFGDEAPLLPELQGPEPKVVVVLDTSGSMGYGKASRLATGGKEILGIMRTMGLKPHVITIDAAVFASKELRSENQLLAMLGGGGGTDMRVGILAAADRKIGADVCVLITDCETPWLEAHQMPRSIRVVTVGVGHKIYFDRMPAHFKKHSVFVED